MTTPACESCGLPLTDATEWAPHSASPPTLCRYCTDAAGVLRPYDDVLHDFAALLTRTMGLHADAARTAAIDLMASRPAWAARGAS